MSLGVSLEGMVILIVTSVATLVLYVTFELVIAKTAVYDSLALNRELERVQVLPFGTTVILLISRWFPAPVPEF